MPSCTCPGYTLHPPDRQCFSGLSIRPSGAFSHPEIMPGRGMAFPCHLVSPAHCNKTLWLVNREVSCHGKVAATRRGSSFLTYSPNTDARLHQSPEIWVVRTQPPTTAAATHPLPVLAESTHHLLQALRKGAGRELAQESEAATRAAWKAQYNGAVCDPA